MTNIITDDDRTIDEFKNLFCSTPKVRKLLFGRKDFKSESLFEQILSINKDISMESFQEILQHIWNEFKLWEKPEILTLVSANWLQQAYLVEDYLILL